MNFGFMAGGVAQGLNSARQKAIEQAHLKLQQQQNDIRNKLMQQSMAYRGAENMAAHPETAEAMGNVYPEIDKYTNDPSGYSWTKPSLPATPSMPVAGPPEASTPGATAASGAFPQLPDMPGTPQQDFEPQSGDAGYNAMMSYWGKRARDMAIEGESRKLANALQLLQYKPSVNPDLQEALARARRTGSILGENDALPQVEDNAHARALGSGLAGVETAGPKAQAAGVARGTISPTGGVTSIPAPGGSVQVPVGSRMPSNAEVKSMADLDSAISFVDSMGDAKATGAPGSETGLGSSVWTHYAGKIQGAPVLGDVVKGIDPNLPARAAFHEGIGQNKLANLRTQFGGRITNFDMLFGDNVMPNAQDSDEVFIAKTNELSKRLHVMRDVLDRANQQGGIASQQPVTIQIPANGFLGKIGPATPGLSTQSIPQGQLQIPGAGGNLGVYPSDEGKRPGRQLKTLQFDQP